MSRERRASWGCNQDAGGGKRRLRYWADLRDGKGYRRVWRETLKAAGIEPIPFRNLRNTWRTVSRWELGIPEDMCEKMMGHAGKGIGERHYDRPEADVFADVVAEAYQRLRSGA